MTDRDAVTLPDTPRTNLMTLGERCVVWCREEMRRMLIPELDTLAEWFEPVGRGLEHDVRNGKRYNHCAVTQCFAAVQCAGTDEVIPHDYRSGAKQLKADAIEHHVWHEASELADGWRPASGDLAIYDRSIPGRPDTSWYGHVDRVTEVYDDGFQNIGANEGPGGAWRVQVTPYSNDRLLGFVAYPVGTVDHDEPRHLLSPRDILQAKHDLIVSLGRAEARYWEELHRS